MAKKRGAQDICFASPVIKEEIATLETAQPS